ESGFDLLVYISMAFGNPYGDLWDEDKVRQAIGKIIALEIRSISLADTAGVAAPELVGRLVCTVISDYGAYDIGVHMHSTHVEAASKVLAAYDAGCRRIDSAIGGLGGCPFAQNILVGNIPTESVFEALRQRGVELPIGKSLENVLTMTSDIASKCG